MCIFFKYNLGCWFVVSSIFKLFRIHSNVYTYVYFLDSPSVCFRLFICLAVAAAIIPIQLNSDSSLASSRGVCRWLLVITASEIELYTQQQLLASESLYVSVTDLHNLHAVCSFILLNFL